jgi:hypothetical protein
MDAELRKRFDRKPQTIIGMNGHDPIAAGAGDGQDRGVGRDLIQRD